MAFNPNRLNQFPGTPQVVIYPGYFYQPFTVSGIAAGGNANIPAASGSTEFITAAHCNFAVSIESLSTAVAITLVIEVTNAGVPVAWFPFKQFYFPDINILTGDAPRPQISCKILAPRCRFLIYNEDTANAVDVVGSIELRSV